MKRGFSLSFTLLDFFIVFVVFSLFIFSVFAFSSDVQGEAVVVIESEDGTFLYPIDTDRDIAVAGPLGDTHVRIENNSVRIVESPCPDKLCIAMGRIDSNGQWVACLPNRVFVRVKTAGYDTQVDAGSF